MDVVGAESAGTQGRLDANTAQAHDLWDDGAPERDKALLVGLYLPLLVAVL